MAGGIALDGQLLRPQGLVHSPQVQQGVSAIGGGGVATENLGLLENAYRLLEAAFLVEQDAVHVDSLGVVRLAGQSPAQPLPCACQVALRGAKLAPGHQGFYLFRIEGKGLAQIGFGLGRPAALPLQNCQVDPAADQVGAQFDGAQQGSLGVDLAPLFAQQAAQVDPGGGKVRAQGESAAVASFGLPRPSHARQDKADGKLGLGHPRANRHRQLVVFQCFIVAAQAGHGIAQAHVCRGQNGLVPEGEIKLTDCVQ